MTESPVELSESQLAVQACIACGAIGATTYWPEADVRWWIGIRGERHGPYVLAQLQGMAATGRLSPNSYVWGPNFASWARAGTLPDFAGRFVAAAPPAAEPARPAAVTGPAQARPEPEVRVDPAPQVAAARPAPEASPPTSLDLDVKVASPSVEPVAEAPVAPPVPAAVAPPPIPAAAPKVVAPPPVPVRKVALDDARRPPPTRFGLPVVVPVAPDAVASAAEPTAGEGGGRAGGRGLTRLGGEGFAADALSVGRSVASDSGSSSIGTLLEPVPTRESQAVPAREAAASSEAVALDVEEDFFAASPPESTSPHAAQGHDQDDAEAGGLFANASPLRVRHPSQHEMQALRQEFSVVARLERHKRKRFISIALVAGGVVGLAALAAIFTPAREYFTGGRGTGADGDDEYTRATYEVPKKAVTVAEGEAESNAEAAGKGSAAGGRAATGGRKKPRAYDIGDDQVAGNPDLGLGEGPTAVPSSGAAGLDSVEARAARIRSLAAEADQFGKSEVALGFDSNEAARKAEAAAAERKSATTAEQGQKVAAAFASKLGQFKRCSTENQEKVRAIFTVTIHGKVIDPQVTGTNDIQKRDCVLGILRQAVFPAGDSAQTFSQTVTL